MSKTWNATGPLLLYTMYCLSTDTAWDIFCPMLYHSYSSGMYSHYMVGCKYTLLSAKCLPDDVTSLLNMSVYLPPAH